MAIKVEDCKIEITLINSASWKIKALKKFISFLNWMTIPKRKRNKTDVVINVKFEVE
jgi:hypothetical protein